MTPEMEYFTFLLEQYAKYKNTTADKVLSQWDKLNITDFIFSMYERYHTEAIENAFNDIDKLIISNQKTDCNAKTKLQMSQEFDCTTKEPMQIDNDAYDSNTGKPKNDSYLEKGLPKYLSDSLCAMIESWKIEDSGKRDIHWDIHWCELNADINSAETEQEISSEQAWYLRRKYLRMDK